MYGGCTPRVKDYSGELGFQRMLKHTGIGDKLLHIWPGYNFVIFVTLFNSVSHTNNDIMVGNY